MLLISPSCQIKVGGIDTAPIDMVMGGDAGTQIQTTGIAERTRADETKQRKQWKQMHQKERQKQKRGMHRREPECKPSSQDITEYREI
jgi:hypothetical protein